MASAARASFITGVQAFSSACDKPIVIAPDEVGAFLRRGMTVAAFNLLESFLEQRLDELASHVNAGVAQFLDLPERLQRRAITQTLGVARAKLRKEAFELADLRNFSSAVGTSLSAVSGSIALSGFTWGWSGSNIHSDDINAILKNFQVENSWGSVRDVAGRLGFAIKDVNGSPTDLKADLQALANERHKAAHVASHAVSSLWLRAIPTRILRVAVSLDLVMSAAAHLIHTGDASMLAGARWDPAKKLSLRFIKERSPGRFAEMPENATRARKVLNDGDRLFAEAANRCGPHEGIVRQGLLGQIVDWALPSVG